MGERNKAKDRATRRPAGQAPRRAPATQVLPVPLSARARGCKGRSPLHKKTKSPLPVGKGVGGMGAANKAQGRASRRPAGQTTRWAPPMLVDPPTCRASPPAGRPQRRCCPCRFRLGRGDARGEAPCIRKLKAPFPTGRGAGGWGHEIKLKARSAADLPGKPPPGSCMAVSASAVDGSAQGCRGRSPLHKKTKSPPSRREERSASAGRGDGARNH